jgi:hypothetical protein
MSLFGNSKEEKECLGIIKDLSETVLELVRPKKRPMILVLIQTFNNQKILTMSLSLASNQTGPVVLGLVDSVTGQPVTATFANSSYSIDNTSVATVDANGNISGVAAGTFNLSVTTAATYTDSTGTLQSGITETGTFPGTVTAVVTADGVALVATLGTLTTQPAPAVKA